jgi:adenylate cyclase class 2
VYEVELKCRAKHGDVRDRLDAVGASRLRAVTQRDVYYDAPHRNFAETDEAFRIRRERVVDENDDGGDASEPVSKLTYKGPLVEKDSKTRVEHETVVDDETEARAIVEALGFEPAAVVEKERTFFELDGYTVTLDTVSELGEFVEIETGVETDGEVPAARNRARKLLKTLGVDPDENIRTSYLGLLFEAGAADRTVDAS